MRLLPCPFCGNEDSGAWNGVRMRRQEITDAGYGIPLEKPEQRFFVYCGACGARGGIGQSGKMANGITTTPEQAEEIATRKWNTQSGFIRRIKHDTEPLRFGPAAKYGLSVVQVEALRDAAIDDSDLMQLCFDAGFSAGLAYSRENASQ